MLLSKLHKARGLADQWTDRLVTHGTRERGFRRIDPVQARNLWIPVPVSPVNECGRRVLHVKQRVFEGETWAAVRSSTTVCCMDRRGAAWPIRGLQDRSPRTALAPGRVHGRILKMLKSLNSIGRGYLHLLAKPGLPSIKYDRSIERSHRTGCDQSHGMAKMESAETILLEIQIEE